MKQRATPAGSPAIGTAFWGALAGGSVLLLAALVPLPSALIVGAALALVTSVAVAGVLSARETRRTGRGVVSVLSRGAGTAARWLFWFLPP